MSDELPEWPTDTPPEDGPGIEERIGAMLHQAFNEQPLHIGPQIITKWIVIAEIQGHNTAGPGLRWIDSDLTPWDKTGLLQYVLDEEKKAEREDD